MLVEVSIQSEIEGYSQARKVGKGCKMTEKRARKEWGDALNGDVGRQEMKLMAASRRGRLGNPNELV